jgi:hypothetical protein
MVSIEIETRNAAFEGQEFGLELHRILTKLADRVVNWTDEDHPVIPIIDVNGNCVGEAVIEIYDD